jgi:hypothetical protein
LEALITLLEAAIGQRTREPNDAHFCHAGAERMTGAQYRVSLVIERCGEDITVGEGSTVGIVTLLHPEAARKYLTDTEIDAAGRPIYAIMLKHDDGIAETELQVNSDAVTVIRVIVRQLKGVTVYKIALAA